MDTIVVTITETKYKIRDWTRGKKIGEGAFGVVYLATDKDTGKTFAVKTVNMLQVESRLCLFREKALLKKCKSPYIVQFFGAGISKAKRETDKSQYFDLYMEYVQGGNVLHAITSNAGGLEEPTVASYARDVLRGLNYLHQKHDAVHGDLKCENLLLGEKCIKICDFGSCKNMKDGDLFLAPRPGEGNKQRLYVTGTPGYMAPEVEDEVMQDRKSDIYSLGCCIVEMLIGEPPSKDPNILAWEDGSGCRVDVPPFFSAQGEAFVRKCLQTEPANRPEAFELLRDKWIMNAPPYIKLALPPAQPQQTINSEAIGKNSVNSESVDSCCRPSQIPRLCSPPRPPL